MPIYEFKCVQCGESIEVIQHFDDPAPEHCDEAMERVLAGGNIGLNFKGECWAKDGYTKRGKADGNTKKDHNTKKA